MADRPLLIFPSATSVERPKKEPRGGSPNYSFPEVSRQKDRLTPMFQSMQEAFLSDTSEGIEPEKVLVLEIIGELDGFLRAVRAIEGLEWLGEIDVEDIAPDDEFFLRPKIGKRLISDHIAEISNKQSSVLWKILEDNNFINKYGYRNDKDIEQLAPLIPSEYAEFRARIVDILRAASVPVEKLSGRLLLSMSNQQALNKILTLWSQWDANRKFRHGNQKWSDVFTFLKNIRRWDVSDRLRETGVLKQWQENIENYQGQQLVPFEVELWYRDDRNKRETALKHLQDLVLADNGNIIGRCTIEEIRFCAVKAELPASMISNVLNSTYTALFHCEDIMYFRPSGQCPVEVLSDGEPGDFSTGTVSGHPLVAVLDGDPFANHQSLENRLLIDDPDDFGSSYLAGERKHGTAIASLICHGELDANEPPIDSPVYFRPIMMPDPGALNRREAIPKDRFFEDLIERSVRRMFEATNGEMPIAPTVKVINISIADPAKPFYNRLSSTSRLLDWLSFKYNVLFCVSAGNIAADIELDFSESEFMALNDNDKASHTVNRMRLNIRNQRIMSPAESINSITAGAIHSDQSTVGNLGSRLDILPDNLLPSPISPCGFGFRSSVKPDVFISGGRQLYQGHGTKKYRIIPSTLPPGQKVATAALGAGETNRYTYCCGTSNAAALASRYGVKVCGVLQELNSQSQQQIPEKYFGVLLKTLIVHSTTWGQSKEKLESYFGGELSRRDITRLLGYGTPNIQRVLQCTQQRATAIGFGTIKKDQRHQFELPLPPSLRDSNDTRRLTITLGWFSPINAKSKNYRKANLSFDPPVGEKVATSRQEADWQKARNGTIQHEIFSGNDVLAYNDNEKLIIPIECREDAGNLDEEVCYGLAVTLEVAEDVNIHVYDEIREKLSEQIAIRESV